MQYLTPTVLYTIAVSKSQLSLTQQYNYRPKYGNVGRQSLVNRSTTTGAWL